MKNITFYNDFLIVEALLQNSITKCAQQNMIDGIVNNVKQYIENNINPNDKAGSILNMLAPGIISTTLGAMGLGKIGFLLGLAARFFHLDVAGILRSIWSKLKEQLSNNKQISSEQVNNIAKTSVEEHNSPPTKEEADDAAKQNDQSPVHDHKSQIRLAKLLSLALDEYQINKSGQNWFSAYSKRKSATSNLLANVLSFVLRVVLSAAGLMVAGDLMNKLLHKPNALDSSLEKQKEQSSKTNQTPVVTNKFTLNPSYQDITKNTSSNNWVEHISNNSNDISEMLTSFVKDVYQVDDSQEQEIKSSSPFKHAVDNIAWYNHTAAGGPLVFIPKMFATKKQLVDSFI